MLETILYIIVFPLCWLTTLYSNTLTDLAKSIHKQTTTNVRQCLQYGPCFWEEMETLMALLIYDITRNTKSLTKGRFLAF